MNVQRLFFAVLVIVVPKPMQAGASSSSGGGVFVNFENTSSILLDLWESDIANFPADVFPTRGLRIDYSNEDGMAQIDRAMARLKSIDEGFHDETRQNLEFLMDESNHWHIPHALQIPPPHDAQNDFHPAGWKLAGMFLFDDRDQVLSINKDVFDKLANQTHWAAAFLHEAIYKTLRDNRIGGQGPMLSSYWARRLNACLFSQDLNTKKCLKKFTAHDPQNFTYICRNENLEVWIEGERLLESYVEFTKFDGKSTRQWADNVSIGGLYTPQGNLMTYGFNYRRPIIFNGADYQDNQLVAITFNLQRITCSRT